METSTHDRIEELEALCSETLKVVRNVEKKIDKVDKDLGTSKTSGSRNLQD